MLYEVRYYREDKSFGAYCGTTREAFESEIKMCLRCGFEFTATAKKEEK